ncbi:MAG TPA: fused MFS/spermidine synthase, partial [Polyangiaceae bacterium]|nr:fused MFS/spermidine synthase [Polyangiaceae bacterium]
MHPGTRTVALLLFGSGMAALVYQTAWQRMLRLVFGASTAASAAVIAIFLGGLGVGGIWLGKRAERSAKPLEFYGTLEAGVAVCAASTPALVLLAETLYFGSGGSARLGVAGATALRVVLALIVMGPAVVLMGGTLPAAARSVESAQDRARSQLAFLYAANTAGAVVGALLGTFLLFEMFGTRLTLWIAALINLLVALVARSIGRDAEPVPVTAIAAGAEVTAGAGGARDGAAPVFTAHSSYVYGMAAMVGFAFVALELVWYRMLGPVLGGSSFMFGLILAVALAGIGTGGYFYSRRSPNAAVSLKVLASTLALEALCVAIPLALGDRIAFFAAYTRPMAAMGFSALVVSWTLISVAVVFPASVVAGYQFPVLFALLGQGRERVARQVGLAYAFNTFGSIAGALLLGFVMIPRLGAVASWRAMVLLLAVLFALTLLFEFAQTRTRPTAS